MPLADRSCEEVETSALLAPSDQKIVEIALAELMAELGPDLLGLLASGSRVNGRVDPNSDFDLVAILDSPRVQRRTRFIRGVEVVIDLAPRDWVLRTFDRDRATGSGMMQHMFATGVVFYDTRDAVRSLRAEATRQWELGPTPVAARDLWRLRAPPAKMLADAELAMNADPAVAAHVLSCLLVRLLDAHYRVHGRWTEKAKRAVDDLSSWDPTAATLLRWASVGSIPERVRAARELVAHCLADIGGPMPSDDWSTDWQEHPPTPGRVSPRAGRSRSPRGPGTSP